MDPPRIAALPQAEAPIFRTVPCPVRPMLRAVLDRSVRVAALRTLALTMAAVVATPAPHARAKGSAEAAPVTSSGAAPVTSSRAAPVTSSETAPVAPPETAPLPPPESAPVPPSSLRRAAATAAAVVPGLVLHGAGSFVLGERRTARRLLAIEGVGIAAMGVGIAALALTGASRETTWPVIGVTAAGAGLFATSALADVYGVLAPPGGVGLAADPARWIIEAGPAIVRDPTFEPSTFARQTIRVARPGYWLAGAAWIGLDGDNQRLTGVGARRLLGRDHRGFLDVELGVSHHRHGRDAFSVTLAEVMLAGRLDLAVVGPTLAGAFVDGGFGYAAGGRRYFDRATEFEDMTLARLGFGLWLGKGPRSGGEVAVFYDHRHDDFAAGAKMPGLGSGVLGHGGVRARVFFTRRWGLTALAEAGSAHVFGLGVVCRSDNGAR